MEGLEGIRIRRIRVIPPGTKIFHEGHLVPQNIAPSENEPSFMAWRVEIPGIITERAFFRFWLDAVHWLEGMGFRVNMAGRNR